MDLDWPDVLRGALSFFLIIVGIGIAWACIRLGGLFGRVSTSVTRMTDEVVPILSKAQTTMDGINTEISRVDEIMQSAVATTKGAEKAVATVSRAVTAPAKKLSGLATGVHEAMATFKARRAAEKAGSDGGVAPADVAPPPSDDNGTLSPRESPYPGA